METNNNVDKPESCIAVADDVDKPESCIEVADDIDKPESCIEVADAVDKPESCIEVADDVDKPESCIEVADDVDKPERCIEVADDVDKPESCIEVADDDKPESCIGIVDDVQDHKPPVEKMEVQIGSNNVIEGNNESSVLSQQDESHLIKKEDVGDHMPSVETLEKDMTDTDQLNVTEVKMENQTGSNNVKEKNESAENNGTNAITQQDEYSYIQRDEFTSEIFKIEIQRMPRFGFSELRKKLHNLELKPIKIKGFTKNGFAFVTFRNEEEREKALTKLNGFQWKGNSLTAKKSRPSADPLVMKRKEAPGVADDQSCPKKAKDQEESGNNNEKLTPDQRVKKAVMPFYEKPYEEQLKQKSADIWTAMMRFTKMVQHDCPEMRSWLNKQKAQYAGCVCEILPIRPSPLLEGYRNKSEFTVGSNLDGTEKVVGFRLGSYREGSSAVGEPFSCDILPEAMKRVAKVFQVYVRQNQYPVYDAQTHNGHWRQLTVRTTTREDIMAIPEFHVQQLTPEELEAEKCSLKKFFAEGEGKACGVTSLFFNCVYDRHASCRQSADYEHLMGEKYITENLLEMSFQISPDAFFQINNPATALLYSLVADWCQLEPDNTVLDICCGTGTIGLTLAKHVKRVVGVEMCPTAIEDAKKNAALNGVTNIEFHCAKAEDVTDQLRSWSWGQSAVAIVDPPRPGLQSKVMYAIRRSNLIHRVIYISCNPAAAIQNFADLVRPKSRRIKGEAFYPVKAVPVDLFPHTKHCELVVLFERQGTSENQNTVDSSD